MVLSWLLGRTRRAPRANNRRRANTGTRTNTRATWAYASLAAQNRKRRANANARRAAYIAALPPLPRSRPNNRARRTNSRPMLPVGMPALQRLLR